jgi:preprotein translocase subunit SecG
LAIVLAAVAVGATSGREIDESLDRTVAPANDLLAPTEQAPPATNAAPAAAPAETAPASDDPLADVAQ